MSLLPNNTYANPANSFYGEAGGGAANSLQSPAEIIPDATLGDALLNINSAPGAAIAVLTVRGGATGEGNIVIGSQGQDYLLSASGTNDVLTLTAVPAQVGQVSALEYRPATGILTLGDGLAGGFVETNVPLFVGATPVNGNAVKIASFDATTGTINNTVATAGTVKIGSSVANPQGVAVIDDGAGTATTEFVGNGGAKVTIRGGANGVVTPAAIFSGFNAGSPSSLTVGTKLFNNILTVTDTVGGVGTAVIGGNGGMNVSINGGTVADPGGVGANIRTDAASSGILTIGSSTSNPTTLFVKDTGAAGTGFVDVAGGVFNSIALRLQGSNSQVGANSAKVSTNNVAAQNPILNISNSVDGTPAIVVTTSTIQINKLITGYLNGTTAAQGALLDNNSAGIPGSDYGSLGAGLFTILATTTNPTSPNGQTGTNVSAQGYMSSVTQKWIGGGGFGQGLINPTRNFFIAPNAAFTGLIFGNSSGFDMNATYTITFIRLTGDLGI